MSCADGSMPALIQNAFSSRPSSLETGGQVSANGAYSATYAIAASSTSGTAKRASVAWTETRARPPTTPARVMTSALTLPVPSARLARAWDVQSPFAVRVASGQVVVGVQPLHVLSQPPAAPVP